MPPEKNRKRSMYDASKMALLSKFPKKIKHIFLDEKNPVDKLKRLSKEGKLDDTSQSFVDFLQHPFFKKDPLLIEEKIKLWDFWKKGGSPFVKMLRSGEGEVGGRPYYKRSDAPSYRKLGENSPILQVIEQDDDTFYAPDTLNIYEDRLLSDYMAEISHGMQYARKEGESVKDWKDRRRKLQDIARSEKILFGSKRYGQIKGSDPTHEFKAHSIIEPSLWREYRGIRKSIFGGN